MVVMTSAGRDEMGASVLWRRLIALNTRIDSRIDSSTDLNSASSACYRGFALLVCTGIVTRTHKLVLNIKHRDT
jgi:hypothetical protein